jgi:uncharacterized protein (TIGR02996 family)
MARPISLPPLGKGLETAAVRKLLVRRDAVVRKGRPLLEVEAAKCIGEITSPVAGRLAQWLVKEGDQVEVGQTLCYLSLHLIPEVKLIEATLGEEEEPTASPTLSLSPEERAFAEAILDHPDEDAPRLAYAQWLDTRGDPRGRFIRIQCELANPANENPRHRRFLQRQEQKLIRRYRTAWWEALPFRFLLKRFDRGFMVLAIATTAREFLDRGEGWFGSLVPHAFDIRLFEAKEHIAALAASPLLRRLTGLELVNNGLDGADIRALVASPYLNRLTTLDLSSNSLGDEGVRALAASPCLRRLTRLVLRWNRIGDGGVRELAASPHLTRLTSLNLSGNQIGDAGAEALAGSPSLVHLKSLNLGAGILMDMGNQIGEVGAQALAASPYLMDLDELYLRHNPLGDAGRQAVVARFGRRVHLLFLSRRHE